jgi:alkylhydroperoxidase family enzyme
VEANETMAQVVEGGLRGEWQTGPLREEARAVLPFLEKLTLSPDEVGPEDVRKLREAGLSNEAIRDAIYICAAFNVIDRIADAFGFEVPPPDHTRNAARFLLKVGYRG